jgi:1-acyl-sn-glycerol-3-phosphate acyltransferase
LRAAVNSVFFGLWTAFMVTFAISCSLILRDPNVFRRMQRSWARGLTRFWGVELSVFGAENMPQDASYVVMSNHASYADIVALFIALPITPGFLAKRELMRVPFLAAALRAGGHVIIDRGRRDSTRQALDTAAAEVRAGKTVLIFPEGTRGDSASVGHFKTGGFHLAKSAAVPILPVGLRGTGAVGPRDSLLIWPGKIEVHIGRQLAAPEIVGRDVPELVRDVRSRIAVLSALPVHEAAPAAPAPA